MNRDDHVAVTSTGRFVGNADFLNHKRREFEKRRASLQQTGTRSAHLTYHRIGDRFGRWSEDYLHCCSTEIVAEATHHGCTHIAFENLAQIRDRISDGKKFQQWAFRALQDHVVYKADEHGIVVETVEPSYTSQQCSKCGCTLEENRAGQQFACLGCSYAVNADYNAAKNVARKLALTLQRGQKSLAGGAFCQYDLKSGIMTVSATDMTSDTPVRQNGSPPTSPPLQRWVADVFFAKVPIKHDVDDAVYPVDEAVPLKDACQPHGLGFRYGRHGNPTSVEHVFPAGKRRTSSFPNCFSNPARETVDEWLESFAVAWNRLF